MASVIQKSRRIARRGMVVLSVTATMAISGVAFASWTLSGSGDGAAAASTANDLAAVSLEVDNALYPGLETSATLTVTNPNPFPVKITAVTFTGSVTVAGNPDGCTIFDDHQVTFSNIVDADLFVPVGTEPHTVVLNDVVAMGTAAADECQGQSFEQAFDLDAESTVAP
jgi:hypothetical protein